MGTMLSEALNSWGSWVSENLTHKWGIDLSESEAREIHVFEDVQLMVFEALNITRALVSKTAKVIGNLGSDTLKGTMVSETIDLTGPWVPSKSHLSCQYSVSYMICR